MIGFKIFFWTYFYFTKINWSISFMLLRVLELGNQHCSHSHTLTEKLGTKTKELWKNIHRSSQRRVHLSRFEPWMTTNFLEKSATKLHKRSFAAESRYDLAENWIYKSISKFQNQSYIFGPSYTKKSDGSKSNIYHRVENQTRNHDWN